MATASGVIGPETVVRGSLSGSGSVIVHGRVEGNVSLDDELTVEEGGLVAADVEARTLSIHGQLRGDVKVTGRVVVGSTAAVVGDIRAPRIVIEDGARFSGSIQMEVALPEDI